MPLPFQFPSSRRNNVCCRFSRLSKLQIYSQLFLIHTPLLYVQSYICPWIRRQKGARGNPRARAGAHGPPFIVHSAPREVFCSRAPDAASWCCSTENNWQDQPLLRARFGSLANTRFHTSPISIAVPRTRCPKRGLDRPC